MQAQKALPRELETWFWTFQALEPLVLGLVSDMMAWLAWTLVDGLKLSGIGGSIAYAR